MDESFLYQIKTAFPEIRIDSENREYEDSVSQWKEVYSGNPPWIFTRRTGLYARGERRIASMNAAKVLCDEFADMTFGCQADIYIDDEAGQKYVNKILTTNSFWEKMNEFLSSAFALGGGVIRLYINEGEICFDYLSAENFLPVTFSSRGIECGIFRSKIRRNNENYWLFEKHGRDAFGYTEVESRLFVERNGNRLERVDINSIFPGQPEKISYPVKTPLFAYFKPAVANNLYPCSATGISVFANCFDTLKALDIALDSLTREFILGRKRIIVPSSCIRTVVDPETGMVRRYFDADDEVYQALKCDDETDLKITDNTTELRVDEHVSAINSLMNLLCFQTGLSSGTLSFGSSQGVRTAAEITSQENRTERTINSNRNLAAEFIESLVKSILQLGVCLGDIQECDENVRVVFNKKLTDSVDEHIDRVIKLLNADIIDRDRAKKMIEENENL